MLLMENLKKRKKKMENKKELFIRARVDDNFHALTIDMKKINMSEQEVIGILEVAKDRILEEIRQKQASVVFKK